MRTLPLALTLLALCAMFLVALYTAFGFTVPVIVLTCLLVLGLASSLLPYRYYGWPYAEKGTYTDVDSAALYELIRTQKDLRIVDVRSRTEYARGHIPGAINIPFTRIAKNTALPVPTVFVCSTGHRSRMALRKSRGKELYNLAHGYRKWIEAAFPVETGKKGIEAAEDSQSP
ncbi:MAG: rhodanese-like domain-containing protein [Thermoplasmata archaeon]|nr:rhodanese-like domain-containing protein [Candidatus Sysuiplasma acidicola]